MNLAHKPKVDTNTYTHRAVMLYSLCKKLHKGVLIKNCTMQQYNHDFTFYTYKLFCNYPRNPRKLTTCISYSCYHKLPAPIFTNFPQASTQSQIRGLTSSLCTFLSEFELRNELKDLKTLVTVELGKLN